MNKSKKRICGSMAVGAIIALVIAAPASATQLAEITIETDKGVYEVGESVQTALCIHNAGDEDIGPFGDEHWYPMWIWLFENAEGLGRDALLATEQPVWTATVSVTSSQMPPGYAYTTVVPWDQHDDLGHWVGSGYYTLLGVEGPYPWAWEGATVDYSNAIANFTIVPEPGTLSLLAGLAAAGLLRKAL